MVEAPDLTVQFPRSPRERLVGLVHLPRMIDKARAMAAGTLGEYIFPCPLDLSLLDFLKIDAQAFCEAAAERDDPGMEAWVRERARALQPDQIREWNEQFLSRRPTDDEGRKRFDEIRERVAPGRMDVTTWVQLLDIEEGRMP